VTKNNPDKLGHTSLGSFSKCPKSKECANDACFFRKRDELGMFVWWGQFQNMDVEEAKHQEELQEIETLWPKLKITPGTNCYGIWCEDEMLP
jgi:hypothetical protein